MYLSELVLRKKWLRSDKLWASRLAYRDPVRRIPLLLDTWVLMRSQYWPRARIDALAEMRLRDIIMRTADVPLMRRRYLDAGIDPKTFTRSDFSRLPLLTKSDFFANDVSEYTDARLIAKSHVDHTSGSTGKPLQFHLDWRAELRYFAIRERMFRSVAGGEKLPVVYFRGRINPGFFFANHVLFFLKGYNDIIHRLDSLIELAGSFRRDFILYGYVSSMSELARRVSERGIRLPLRAIVATGENLREDDRNYIEERLQTRFFLTYATWEVKWIGHECQYRRIHINEEYVYVEILDEQGKSLPRDSEGEIVVTSFDSEAMPFIRYALGDRGSISEDMCPCGRSTRTIRLFGRQTDVIDLPDGRRVPLFDLSTAFDTFAGAVRQYRIVQMGLGAFRIQVVPGPEFEQEQERLTVRLISILHPKATIEWELLDFIPQAPSGKARYFERSM